MSADPKDAQPQAEGGQAPPQEAPAASPQVRGAKPVDKAAAAKEAALRADAERRATDKTVDWDAYPNLEDPTG